MEKITKKNSILWNQEWINKALDEGYINFLPVFKLPGKSIGEHIEIKYKQLYTTEFDRYYHNGFLNDYKHFVSNRYIPKVTKKESLLFRREWLLKYQEEKLAIPNKRLCSDYSLGEMLELIYYQNHINELIDKSKYIEKIKLSGEGYSRKRKR